METITGNISIKKILKSKRNIFSINHQGLIRETVFKNVQKVLDCGENLGHISYKCGSCGDIKHIHFSCKSRFCNSCSKPQSDNRINNLYNRIPRGIGYHHIVLTIPEGLRIFFKRHRKALSVLPRTAADSICFFVKKKHN